VTLASRVRLHAATVITGVGLHMLRLYPAQLKPREKNDTNATHIKTYLASRFGLHLCV